MCMSLYLKCGRRHTNRLWVQREECVLHLHIRHTVRHTPHVSLHRTSYPHPPPSLRPRADRRNNTCGTHIYIWGGRERHTGRHIDTCMYMYHTVACVSLSPHGCVAETYVRVCGYVYVVLLSSPKQRFFDGDGGGGNNTFHPNTLALLPRTHPSRSSHHDTHAHL